jgi:hypothetical protein
MSASDAGHGLLARMCDWVKARFVRGDDLSLLSHDDLALMASDLGITEHDLRDVLPKAADNSLLMDEMMIQRGLDPEKVRHLWGGLARELEMTCCRCGSVARCRAELQVGIAGQNAHEYCGNAETFDELLAGA